MALSKLWIIAYRDLGRNKRRSGLTLLAVALGLTLLITWTGLIEGAIESSIQNGIRLKTGHVQIRTTSYEEEKLSLLWQDLLEDTDSLVARVTSLSEVKAAAPVLWIGSILNTMDESMGLQIYGVEPNSALYDPIREGIVKGQFLTNDDRDGILIGERLANKLELDVGDKVNLAVTTADGTPDEGIFTIKGLFFTDNLGYDENSVFMPLSKAQAFTHTDGRASAIVILLHNQADADQVAAALQTPNTSLLTWRELNDFMIKAVEAGQGFYIMLDGIVMLIVAVIIANTLLMAVFERTREMGILASLGMKGRQILLMFLMEALILGLFGVLLGLVLGYAAVSYLSVNGVFVGEATASIENVITYGTTLYAQVVPASMISLAAWTLAITLLASIYPAWFAARLEPVEALRRL